MAVALGLRYSESVVLGTLRRAVAMARHPLRSTYALRARIAPGRVTLATLRPRDAIEVTELYRLPRRRRPDMRARLEHPEIFGVGAWCGGHLIGIGWCSPQWTWLDIPGYWFGGDLVAPGARGCGIGKRLHLERLERAKEQGIDEVFVNTLARNRPAHRALVAVGFAPLERSTWQRRLEAHVREPVVLFHRRP